eukprot:gene4112-4802_t
MLPMTCKSISSLTLTPTCRALMLIKDSVFRSMVRDTLHTVRTNHIYTLHKLVKKCAITSLTNIEITCTTEDERLTEAIHETGRLNPRLESLAITISNNLSSYDTDVIGALISQSFANLLSLTVTSYMLFEELLQKVDFFKTLDRHLPRLEHLGLDPNGYPSPGVEALNDRIIRFLGPSSKIKSFSYVNMGGSMEEIHQLTSHLLGDTCAVDRLEIDMAIDLFPVPIKRHVKSLSIHVRSTQSRYVLGDAPSSTFTQFNNVEHITIHILSIEDMTLIRDIINNNTQSTSLTLGHIFSHSTVFPSKFSQVIDAINANTTLLFVHAWHSLYLLVAKPNRIDNGFDVSRIIYGHHLAAAKLNVKGHLFGACDKQQLLYGPKDIEGHIGLFYKRVFPPTANWIYLRQPTNITQPPCLPCFTTGIHCRCLRHELGGHVESSHHATNV